MIQTGTSVKPAENMAIPSVTVALSTESLPE